MWSKGLFGEYTGSRMFNSKSRRVRFQRNYKRSTYNDILLPMAHTSGVWRGSVSDLPGGGGRWEYRPLKGRRIGGRYYIPAKK